MEMKVVKKFSLYTTHQMKGDPYTKFAKLLQSCPTLCDPIDGSPPGSPVPGILQARILEWVAMPSSRGSFFQGPWVSFIAGIFFTI